MAASKKLPNPGDGQTSILSFTADKFNTVLGPDTWKYALFDDSPIMSAAFDWIGGLGSLMWGTMQDNLGLTTEEPEVAAINEGTKATKATTSEIAEKPDSLKSILQEQLLVQKDILQEIVGDNRKFKAIEKERERKRSLLFNDNDEADEPEGPIAEKAKQGILSWLLNALGFGVTAAGGFGIGALILAALPIAGMVGLVAGALFAAFTDISLGIARADEWGTSKLSAGFGSFLGGQMDVDAAEWVKTLNMGVNAAKWALIGAAIGIPGGPIGMVAGGLIGAAIGTFLGSFGGEYIAKKLDAIGNTLSEFANAIGDWFGEVNDDIVNTVRGWGWTSFGETMDEGDIQKILERIQWGPDANLDGGIKIRTQKQQTLNDFNEETFGVPSLWDTKTPEGREGMSSFLMEKHPEEKELYTPRMIKLKMNDPEKYNAIQKNLNERNEGEVAKQERDRQISAYIQQAPIISEIEKTSGQKGLLNDYFSVLDPILRQELTLMGHAPATMARDIPRSEIPMPGGMNILIGQVGAAAGPAPQAAAAAGGLPFGSTGTKDPRLTTAWRETLMNDLLGGVGYNTAFTGRAP